MKTKARADLASSLNIAYVFVCLLPFSFSTFTVRKIVIILNDVAALTASLVQIT